MNILSALKIKKLNLQNTCTSYYDFLTCEHNCLDSLRCSTVPRDPPSQQDLKRPPKVVRSGVQYFDVDDKAAQWYLDTRRSAAERKPCKRRFCYRFHVPVRHAVRRKDKAATYALPGRRVSPEFLSLLRQHHARMRGLGKLPRKYLSRKASFSYYKYDAAGKSRHMRPGISTAAPVEFPCTNVDCIRHRVCSCPPKKESPPQAPLSQADSNRPVTNTKPRKKLFSPFAKDKAVDVVKKNVNGAKDNLKATDSQPKSRLHRIYASNPSLKPPAANQEPPKPIASKSQPSLNPMEKMKSCPCSIEQPNRWPKSSVPPSKKASKRIRDPRCTEYENRPFFKAINGTNYGSPNGSKKLRRRSEKNYCEDHSETQADVQEDPPSENTFYASVSNHQELGLEHRQRPDLHDQNDIEIPPNRHGNSLGYRGFIHRSENQKLIDRGCAPIPKCKRSKPPPYCYLWSAVDPDIRKAEKHRLAEHNWCQRQMFPDSKPYSYYWSSTNPDVRSQVKRRLKKVDSRRHCGLPRRSIQPPICSRDYSDQNEDICTCSRSTVHQFFDNTNSDSFDHHNHLSCSRVKKLQSFGLGHGRNRKGAPKEDCSLDWEDDHSTSKTLPRWPGLISRKLSTDSDGHLSKKPRLLPRLHAFAKRFLWSGSKAIEFKSNHLGSERPRHSPRSINIREGKSKEKETSDLEHQKDNHRVMCNETNSLDRKIFFRNQASIQDIRGPRDPKLWSKTIKKRANSRRNSKSARSSGSEIGTYRRSNTSAFGLPTCSRRSPRARNYQVSQAKKSSLCNERCSSVSCSHWSNQSSDCLTTDPRPQSPCQVPLVSRAQREWEEHRERKRAKRHVEKCRPCTDYLLTSRRTEPQTPGVRRGMVTYRNNEFTTELSDPCLNEPKRKRFRFTEHCPMHRDKNYSRPRNYRHSARCCDDSDASRHKIPQDSRRMRGGIDFHNMEYSSRRQRCTAHTFPKSLPFKLESNKRGHSPKPWKSPKHLFCFD